MHRPRRDQITRQLSKGVMNTNMHNYLHSQIKTSPYHLNGRGSAWREDIHTATTCFDDRYN
jgi:hypothetical protein